MPITRKHDFICVRTIGGLFIISGLIALLAAYGAEHFLHMVPCELCLWERRPWRILIILGVLVLLLSSRYARIPIILGLLCIVGSIVLSVLHIGVEQGLWQSPAPSCHTNVIHGQKAADWLSHLPDHPLKPCDQPDFPFGLPLSMTELSGLYALIIFILALIGTVHVFQHVKKVQT